MYLLAVAIYAIENAVTGDRQRGGTGISWDYEQGGNTTAITAVGFPVPLLLE